MAQRMQSPSSINLYKQCPRKYYYRYIERLPTKKNIYLIRGSLVHEVLEHFFETTVENNWQTELQKRILTLFKEAWEEAKEELEALELTPEELRAYREETMHMLINWVNHFSKRMKERIEGGETPEQAFDTLTPRREEEYRDEELQVRGYIDAIEEHDEQVTLLDYKTSKKNSITPEYKLQLGIYALLYYRRHQRLPEQVGIHFLKHERSVMEVNDELLLDAQFEIEQIHLLTRSDEKMHYPKNVTPLCNWCDYYEKCFS